LPGAQLELLKAVAATGTPVVLLLMSGRPLDLSWAEDHIPAIVAIWHPGTSGGSAVANLVFGQSTPGGKLPFSWPRSVGQIPLIYSHTRSHDPAGQDRRYWEGASDPLFPFGFGLSYGALELSEMRLGSPSVTVGEGVKVEVDVANSGDRPVDEVVQVYVLQKWGTTARPVRELKAFQRARLEPDERRTLLLSLSGETFMHWSSSCKAWASEASDFEVSVGFSSQTKCSMPLSVASRVTITPNN
jgi:beta-glucosidase